MKNSIKILFGTIILVAAIIGCSDTPNDLGSDILKDDFGQDIIAIKVFNSHETPIDQTSEVFEGPDSISSHSSSLVLLGNIDNLNSKFLMKFSTSLPDSVLVPLKNGDIIVDSAMIEIKPQVIIGKNDPDYFQFNMFDLNDKIDEELKKDGQINFNIENLVSNIKSTDTLITAELNKDIITKWLQEKNDDSTANYGALFTAINNVVRINSTVFSDGQTGIKIKYVLSYPDKWTDTLEYRPTIKRTLINGETPNYSNEEIVVQGGIPVRSNFWFNKDQLPQQIAVNSATLQFFIDEEKSILRKSGSDSLEVSFYVNEAKDSLDFAYGSAFLTKSEDGKSFTGNVANFVEQMIEKDYKFGFRIKSRSEMYNVSKIIIKNQNAADISVRPKLTINYSQRNK